MQPAREPPKTGIVTFLTTDIEGSVSRWETFPEVMGAIIARHDDLIRVEIAPRDGVVFKTSGDGLIAAFNSPAAAIESAVAAQRALSEADFSTVDGLRVRMAVYAGSAEAVDGDYVGPAINRCSRLLSLACGGQILVGAAAAELARGALSSDVGLKDLGQHKLRDVPHPETLFQVTAPGLDEAFSPLRSGCSAVHNLPSHLSSFVARPSCSSAIRERLDRHRVVTLVGSGGIGKTRMAVETASTFRNEGIGGTPLDEIWFIELGSLLNPVLIPEAVCCAMGIDKPADGSLADAAIGYLKNKRTLLVFDNCEHVIDACCDLITRLLRGCPGVSVLATSRERLAMTGECSYTVPGLELPPDAGSVGFEEALRCEAVRLFAERAALIEGFVLSETNIEAACSICRQLDGVPIAIELAIPHLRTMRIDDLREGLRTQVLGIRAERADMPRHRSLSALFDWSHDLLDDEERALFCRLSVFAGSWSLQGAVAVAGREVAGSADVLTTLTSLVDKSLVIVSPSDAEQRYDFLQPVRQYASRKLQEGGDKGCLGRVAVYFTTLFSDADRTWPTTATDTWLAAYQPELTNIRVTLDRAFAPGGDIEPALELTGYAFRLWDELSMFEERLRYQELAAARTSARTTPAVSARLWLASVSDSHYGDRMNLERATRAAALFREAGNGIGEGEARAKAGAAILTPDTIAEAIPLLHEAFAVLSPLGPTKPLAGLLRSFAVARYLSEDFDGARVFIAQSEGVARTLGDDLGLVATQITAAELAFAAHEPEEAIAMIEILLAEGRGNRRQHVLAQGNLAGYRLALDRLDDAHSTALESLLGARSLLWPAAVTRAAEHIALVFALRGQIEMAAPILGFGDAFYRGETASRERTERATSERLRALLSERLPSDRLIEAMTAGAAWDLDRVVKVVASIG